MAEESQLQLYLSVEKNKETALEEGGRLNAAVYFYVLLFEYTGMLGMTEWNVTAKDFIFSSQYALTCIIIIMNLNVLHVQYNVIILCTAM